MGASDLNLGCSLVGRGGLALALFCGLWVGQASAAPIERTVLEIDWAN
jgi:hypothetical protein